MIYIISFFASLGFALLYNVRGHLLFLTALGGSLGKLILDLTSYLGLTRQFLMATIAIAIYSEIMARFSKTPVMIYLIVGVLPIVPGAGVYRTMSSLFQRDSVGFMQYGVETLLASGSIAFAIVLVSSTVRIFKLRRVPFLQHHKKSDYKPHMR